MVSRVKATHVPQSMKSGFPLLITAVNKYPTFQQWRPILSETSIWHQSLRQLFSNSNTLDPFYWDSDSPWLKWIHILGIGFPLLSTGTPYYYPSTYRIPRNITQANGSHFKVKERQSLSDHMINWPYHILNHHKAAGPIEWWMIPFPSLPSFLPDGVFTKLPRLSSNPLSSSLRLLSSCIEACTITFGSMEWSLEGTTEVSAWRWYPVDDVLRIKCIL